MKNMARVNFVIAGACGLLLAVGGASPAQAWDGPFDDGGGVWNSDTFASFHAGFNCSHRARICINGPLNSGNVRNSQNVHLSGNQSNSGSPTNVNGNTNDDAGGTTGAENKTSNNQQHIGHGGKQRL
ncbi:hypothetical protein [Streptomyces sioyaensis]|uniref:Secreted protein n=1 Tax=Streptomyces auratus AGR0001 TaxID=1160718 RepID=J2K100_9ACTN|nr:hypothetical protein [Streptomyces auratus]QTZ96137.1 hypothetical protein SU9_016505 [Streptomyces auratus AGR0001]